MATLLIKAKDFVNPDPVLDREGSCKAGYIIAVQDDGATWGRMESKQQWIADGYDPALWPGKVYLLKVTGIPVAKIQDLISEQVVDDTGMALYETDGVSPKKYRLREWKFDITKLPASKQAEIAANGETTVNPSSVVGAGIKRIRDNAAYKGLG